MHRSAGRSKSRGSLDEIGAREFRQYTGSRLLIVVQQRRFDNHLDDRSVLMAHIHYRLNVELYRFLIAGFEGPDVDHHIDLFRADAYRRLSLGPLHLSGSSTERESDNRADLHRRDLQ